VASKLNKIFSGNQPHQLAIGNVTGCLEASSHIRTLMTVLEMVPEMSVSSFNQY
jgi:hypothetical protein